MEPVAAKSIAERARPAILNGCSARNDKVDSVQTCYPGDAIHDILIHLHLVLTVVGETFVCRIFGIGPRLVDHQRGIACVRALFPDMADKLWQALFPGRKFTGQIADLLQTYIIPRLVVQRLVQGGVRTCSQLSVRSYLR